MRKQTLFTIDRKADFKIPYANHLKQETRTLLRNLGEQSFVTNSAEMFDLIDKIMEKIQAYAEIYEDGTIVQE